MSEEEVEAFRIDIINRGKALDKAEVRERTLYGALILTFTICTVCLYSLTFTIISAIVYSLCYHLALIALSIYAYDARNVRLTLESDYYKRILGRAYHD